MAMICISVFKHINIDLAPVCISEIMVFQNHIIEGISERESSPFPSHFIDERTEAQRR